MKEIGKSFFKDYTRIDILRAIGVIVIYVISGKLGLLLATVNASATAIWAPTGIAIGSILVFGNRMIPAILIGAFLTNVTTAGNIATSIFIALGNTLEGVTAAYLITKYASGVKAFKYVRHITIFVVIALSTTTISATIGVTTLLIFGLTNLMEYNSIWGTWWLGDAAGAIIVAPLVTLWLTTKYNWGLKRILEALALIVMLFVTSQLVFAGNFHFTYLAIPTLLWAAIRFGPREAATVVFFFASIGTAATLSGVGPFIDDGQDIGLALLLLQLYVATIAVVTMITAAVVYERRKQQIALESSEKRFKSLIEKSYDGISLVNKDGKIVYTSPATENILGYTPEEYLKLDPFTIIHPDDAEMIQKQSIELFNHPNVSRAFQYRVKHKNGDYKWLDVIGTNLLDDPAVQAIVANFRDVTEDKQIQGALLQEKAEDEALIESIGDGIIATDKSGKISLVNKSFLDLIGMSQNEIIGKDTFEVLKMQDEKGDNIVEDDRPLTKALKEKKKVATIHYLKKSDGTWFPASIVASPVILNNEVIGAIKVLHDITKEMEIDKAKTEFVSLASHQLKTPLTIINWSIEMINKNDTGGLNEKQKKYLHEVYMASLRMVDLTNALLTISRLELGKILVETEAINLSEVIDQAISVLKLEIQKKSIDIQKDYSEDDLKIESDPKLLGMVFQNILSNAVKYTPVGGKIEIRISSKNEKQFDVQIKDNGYGIPKNEHSKIFSKLFRGSNIQTHDQNGTGLGLYIVKAMLDRIGGKVRFESEENKGTSFFLTIPKKGHK